MKYYIVFFCALLMPTFGYLDIDIFFRDYHSYKLNESSVYKSPNSMKLCWIDIMYVKETNNGEPSIWHVYKITLSDDGKIKKQQKKLTKNDPKKYRRYGVELNDRVAFLKFEILETGSNYVLSKHENVTCGGGRFLTKKYSPARDEVFIEVTDDERSLIDDDTTEFTTISKPETTIIEEIIPTTTDDIFIAEPAPTTSTPPSTTSSPDVICTADDPAPRKPTLCSPIIAQLIPGTMWPALCNITNDDKLILKSDIYISKKGENSTTQPVLVIHQNMEIEAQPNENNKIESPYFENDYLID